MTLYDAQLHGPKKTLTCTLATPTWTADGSTIPATESTRWGRTLQASDFPTWSFQPASCKYVGKVFISIYNNSGDSKSINWKIYKNNTQVLLGSSPFNNLNYGGMTANFYNVTVGDVIEIAIWFSPNTNITVQGYLFHVVPTQLLPTSKPCIDVNYSFDKYTYPSPLSSIFGFDTREYLGSNITNSISSATSRTFTGLSFISQNSYGLFRYGAGDYFSSNNVYGNSSASLQNIAVSYYPTTITYRELLL
jgi:hypothetical protein